MHDALPAHIQTLVDQGALFIINHSGGKDSQAMTIYLRRHIPEAQLRVVHAVLPEVDWDGIKEHIEATAPGIPAHYCSAVKTFFEMVEQRQMWPSPKYRQCTSDLKRGPIDKVIRSLCSPHKRTIIVNCMGMRAAESSARSKLEAFKWQPYENSKGKPTGKSVRASARHPGREWYDWLPIHSWSTAEVFRTIAEAGQQPHWAYQAGMSRLSCCFCIMASKADLQTAAKLRPELFARYVATEHRLDQTMMMPTGGKRLFLDEIVGQAIALAA